MFVFARWRRFVFRLIDQDERIWHMDFMDVLYQSLVDSLSSSVFLNPSVNIIFLLMEPWPPSFFVFFLLLIHLLGWLHSLLSLLSLQSLQSLQLSFSAPLESETLCSTRSLKTFLAAFQSVNPSRDIRLQISDFFSCTTSSWVLNLRFDI